MLMTMIPKGVDLLVYCKMSKDVNYSDLHGRQLTTCRVESTRGHDLIEIITTFFSTLFYIQINIISDIYEECISNLSSKHLLIAH